MRHARDRRPSLGTACMQVRAALDAVWQAVNTARELHYAWQTTRDTSTTPAPIAAQALT